jgi:hypothetical protein
MSNPQFSKQDAEMLVAHAQTAPLANLRHAEQVSQLLQRFAAWYEHNAKEPVAKRRQGSPAGQPSDPAS